ncbi:MAG: hypothetical protein FWC21_05535 [Treponema sp.]|nr:hypothetical protein [Treponema sp.]
MEKQQQNQHSLANKTGLVKIAGITIAALGIMLGSSTLMGCDNGTTQNNNNNNSSQTTPPPPPPPAPTKSNAQLAAEFKTFIEACGAGQHTHAWAPHAMGPCITKYATDNITSKQKNAVGEGIVFDPSSGGVGSITMKSLTVSDYNGRWGGGIHFGSSRLAEGGTERDLSIDY